MTREHKGRGPVHAKSLSRVQLFEIPWIVAPPGSSVHGILQARILEWVSIPFSRGPVKESKKNLPKFKKSSQF